MVIVTGASSGLGEQLARALRAAVPCPCSRRGAPTASPRCGRPARRRDVVCDVTDADDRQRLVDDVMGARAPRRPGQQRRRRRDGARPEDHTDTFARVVDLNLTAPFALACLAARAMREGGGGARSSTSPP